MSQLIVRQTKYTGAGQKARRGTREVVNGDVIYGIYDQVTRRYFVWGYLNKDAAEKVASKWELPYPTALNFDMNWHEAIPTLISGIAAIKV